MEGEEENLEDEFMKSQLTLKNQRLKIFYVNINGLTDKKIQHSDLIEDLKNGDIICFTETHLRDDVDLPKINNYDAYHTTINKSKSIGRNIKGVSVYYKETIPNTNIQEVFKEKGNLLIIKIKNVNWIDINEIFMNFCYKEDRESKFKTHDYFGNLKQHILNYKMKHIIIIGDLNGRIGALNDNKHLNIIPRKSNDPTINGQGKEIIEFCNETSLIIANGRLEEGKCTYFTLHKGEIKKSLIDYLIISESLTNKIKNFQIHEPVPYTDHAPMTIDLTLDLKQNKNDSIQIKKMISQQNHIKILPYKWTESNASKFNNTNFKTRCDSLNNKLKTKYMSAEEIQCC